MSEDNKTQTNEIATVEEHEQTMTRQDRAREKIQQAVNDQQVALAAQQRAVQSTSDAFLAEQDLARRERAGSSQGEIASRGQHAESESRRNFLKISVGVVAGAAIASVVQVPLYAGLVPSRNSDIHTLQAQATSARQEASQLQAQLTAAQTQISQDNAYLILNPDEWSLVEAIGETFIPSDSSGPGFKEAGGIYFIDRQLDGEYGTNGNMYMDSPYVVPGTLGPITVGTQTYLGGAPTVRLGAGTSASGTVDIGGNAYPAGNASGGGTDVFDFADDNFDHTGLNFIGGANFSVGGYLGGGPANLSTIGGGYGGAVTPANIGSAYKVKLKDMYLVTKQVVGATPFAPDIPTTQKYADLDPHHTDMYGDPLTRLTADWVANNYNGATYIAKSFVLPLLQKLGASDAALSTAVNPGPDPVNPGPANIDWWGHHQRGSMRTGSDPSWSVYNKYMQSWSLENLFASGEICNTFGTYVTAGTHPAGPLSYVAAEGIQKYLAGPGPLV